MVVGSTIWIMLLILILNKNLVGCGVLLRDETFMAVAESAFWLESCSAPWEKEVKAFPQRKLQFPVFKVYFVNSKILNGSDFKWAAAFSSKRVLKASRKLESRIPAFPSAF